MRARRKARKAPRKLPVYQYRLPLRKVPDEPKPIPCAKAHIVFYDGAWHMFRSKWKSQFRYHPWAAAAISGDTLRDVIARLHKASDGWRYGYHHPVRTARRKRMGW